MRLPRSYTLPEKSMFHLMWKAINGEFFLSSDEVKVAFLNRLFKFFDRAGGAVIVYAFVVMSNHFHQAGELQEDHTALSAWLRSAHSSFGLWLNRLLNRRGPVAQDRPKTVVIQDEEQLKRTMFYMDWNPVRAGMCQHPSEYRFSTYRYYAFGEEPLVPQRVTKPNWYLQLGSTDEERQEAYRLQCDAYYHGGFVPSEQEADRAHLIGNPESVKRRNVLMRTIGRYLSKKVLIRQELDAISAAVLAPEVWATGLLDHSATTSALAAMDSLAERAKAMKNGGAPPARHAVGR